jgi:hypothetical protein
VLEELRARVVLENLRVREAIRQTEEALKVELQQVCALKLLLVYASEKLSGRRRRRLRSSSSRYAAFSYY